MPRLNPETMRRQIKLWVHPSKSKNDYVVAEGRGVSDEDSTIGVTYRNTEVHVRFMPRHIEISIYAVLCNGNPGELLDRTTHKYSKRSTQADYTKDLNTSALEIHGVDSVKVKADLRHTIVLVAEKNKKPKKVVKAKKKNKKKT